MGLLFLDIETIPANEEITGEDLVSAMPKSIKLEASKAKWILENKGNTSLKASIYKKRSLSMYECRIVCLSYSFDFDPVKALIGTELEILTELDTILDERFSNVSGIHIVGHNSKKFDNPIIALRAAKYKLQTLLTLLLANRKSSIDTMEMGSFGVYGAMVSLDTLCKFFGVESSKGDMDGSMVYQAYKEGRITDIATYCNKDVTALMAVFNHLEGKE